MSILKFAGKATKTLIEGPWHVSGPFSTSPTTCPESLNLIPLTVLKMLQVLLFDKLIHIVPVDLVQHIPRHSPMFLLNTLKLLRYTQNQTFPLFLMINPVYKTMGKLHNLQYLPWSCEIMASLERQLSDLLTSLNKMTITKFRSLYRWGDA